MRQAIDQGNRRYDVRATLRFLFEAAGQRHVSPQISFLSPLAGTPIHANYRDRLKFDGNSSDFSHQGFPQNSADLGLIAAYPDIFQSFYTVPTMLPTAFLQEIAPFVTWALLRCRWLAIALARELGDPLLLCRRWMLFRKLPEGTGGMINYYSSSEFYRDFARFAMASAGGFEARVLASVHSRIAELDSSAIVERRVPGFISIDETPEVPQSAVVFEVAADPEAVIEALVSGDPLSSAALAPVTVAWCLDEHGGKLQRLPAPTARLLTLCDGKRKALAIASTMAAEFENPVEECDPIAGWLIVMERLRGYGLLAFPHRSREGGLRRSGTSATSTSGKPRRPAAQTRVRGIPA